ncbi:MAG: cytochrome-c oxidase, cbb3-type subunit III [Betaproteobacteria bacterium]|nr:cytochrome-c oxidase, cbb3-type subunit III [Betaproteobacteria bacterium]MCL2885622.1 cytochrome-c oxidase, cbb3-type subunit III [Betaproteobacteria bacterium]
MSDFVNDFWNMYVIVIVVASILACAILLMVQGKATFTPGKTMGHVWDETLEEYNNPMPKWWSWMFIITVVFSAGYLVLFPGLGSFPGLLGWTSAKQHQAEVEAMDKAVKPTFDAYLATDLKTLAGNPQAMETGKRLFQTYCMQCHGADARGAKGFPNLTDNDWLYGGAPEQIKETIANGRMGVMPSHERLGAETIQDLVNYVRSLSGLPNTDAGRVARGKVAFTENACSTCHGENGTGSLSVENMEGVGAPNLTDTVWLYGGSEAAVTETITQGRQAKMPAWQEFLGDAKIHLLSAYVLSLSQGK